MVIAGAAVAFVWLSIWIRFRDFEPEAPPQPPDLLAWSFLGCLDIDVDVEPEGREVDPGPEARHGELSLPDLLMLVPDDFDEWGRTYDTYRAWPLAAPDGSAAQGSSYRWFTRADTLWVVWSERGMRGGVALRRDRNGLTGRARLRSGSRSLSGRATARRINCHTRSAERVGEIRR